LGELEPIRESLTGIAVESTYNWYWLVDGLQANRFAVSLVNTSAIHQYEGLKYTDDRHDARWLAHLLRLGVLPTGYIYPPEARAIRDLMRRRHYLVRQRATCLITLKCLFARNSGVNVPTNTLRRMQPDDVLAKVADPHLALAIQSTIRVRERLDEETDALEKARPYCGQRTTGAPAPALDPGCRTSHRSHDPVRNRRHPPLQERGQLRVLLPVRQDGPLEQRPP
jgi:transposase